MSAVTGEIELPCIAKLRGVQGREEDGVRSLCVQALLRGQVTHQRFIEDGVITGLPNQR